MIGGVTEEHTAHVSILEALVPPSYPTLPYAPLHLEHPCMMMGHVFICRNKVLILLRGLLLLRQTHMVRAHGSTVRLRTGTDEALLTCDKRGGGVWWSRKQNWLPYYGGQKYAHVGRKSTQKKRQKSRQRASLILLSQPGDQVAHAYLLLGIVVVARRK